MQGKIRFVGISTRGKDATTAAIEDGFFDTIQLAYSVLDQRMGGKILDEASKKDIGIINRSVLLKGVLAGASKYLGNNLVALKLNAEQASKIAFDVGISVAELAIRFAISNSNIDVVLVGSSRIEHIVSAVRAAKKGPLPKDILVRLKKLAISEPMLIDPSKW